MTGTNRAISDVAGEHWIAGPTVHRALVVAAADLLGQAAPTIWIGVLRPGLGLLALAVDGDGWTRRR